MSVNTYLTNLAWPMDGSSVCPPLDWNGVNSNSIWRTGSPDQRTSCADNVSPRQPLPFQEVEGESVGMADLAYRWSVDPNAAFRPFTGDQSTWVVSGSVASA